MSISHKISDDFMQKLNEILETNFQHESFGVSELAREMGMSRSNLHRKVKAASKISANQYIRQFRLQKGLEMLKQTSFTVSEVSYSTGFSSPAYFIKCFHDYYGYSPGQVGSREESEPVQNQNSLKKRFAIYSSAVSIVIVISVLFFTLKPFSRNKVNDSFKSIAVLHFEDLTPNAEKGYIIHGLRQDILNTLFQIKDLYVVSGAMIDQYKTSDLSIREIAKQLNAKYVLSAKGETLEDTTTIWFELIDIKNGKTIWNEKQILSLPNFQEVRKTAALNVADNLQAKLTEKEVEKINQYSTKNNLALEFYLKGNQYYGLSSANPNWLSQEYRMNNDKSKQYFSLAIREDPDFVEAYLALAQSYIDRPRRNLMEQSLDSGLICINKVLDLEPQNREALGRLANYYFMKGDIEQYKIFHNRIIKASNWDEDDFEFHNANFWYFSHIEDYYNCIKSFYLYKQLKPNELLIDANHLRFLVQNLYKSGFPDVAQKYAGQILKQTNDSLTYNQIVIDIYQSSGDFKTASDICSDLIRSDSSYYYMFTYYLLADLTLNRNYKKALEVMNEHFKIWKEKPDAFYPGYLYGFIYQKNGLTTEAEYYFDGIRKSLEKQNRQNWSFRPDNNLNLSLAALYSAQENKEKTIENLMLLKEKETFSYNLVWMLENWPSFDNFRNDPEFREILAHIKSKYKEEHNKVGRLLKEYGEI